MTHRTQLLDHGYIELVEAWGSDQSIIEAARMSTDKGFLGWGPKHRAACTTQGPNWGNGCDCLMDAPGDEKLLAYLWKHEHATPFEMAGITIEVQAPIFVFREWHRHRVPFGYNELSARYTPIPDFNYRPTLERCKLGGGHLTKQAGTADWSEPLTDEAALRWLDRVEQYYVLGEDIYQEGLRIGIPKELARIVIPVGRYSRMRATGNLRGWLAFMRLRAAVQAQWEIRQYAMTLGTSILSQVFPRTWALVAERSA